MNTSRFILFNGSFHAYLTELTYMSKLLLIGVHLCVLNNYNYKAPDIFMDDKRVLYNSSLIAVIKLYLEKPQ